MPQSWMPRHHAVLFGAGLAAAALNAPTAQAQSAEPMQWPLPSPSPADGLFDHARSFDFSTPAAAAPAPKFDASKFSAAKAPATGWSAKAGVDYAPASGASTPPSSLLLPNAPPAQGSGPAWANVTAPPLDTPLSWDKASIETRLDPQQDQSKLGMKFSRSVPIGSALSVTLQNSYSMTQTLASPAGALPTVPATTPNTTAPGRVLDANQALKFSILPSDTSLSVGATKSTTDAKWLPSLSAEQKLFGGPVNITGSVSETATGEINKTLTGGFKRSW